MLLHTRTITITPAILGVWVIAVSCPRSCLFADASVAARWCTFIPGIPNGPMTPASVNCFNKYAEFIPRVWQLLPKLIYRFQKLVLFYFFLLFLSIYFLFLWGFLGGVLFTVYTYHILILYK